MKRIYFILVGALISTMLFSQCADPLKGFQLNVSTDVIHYTTLLQVEDGNGNLISDLNVAITGADATSIYNLAGNKEFNLNSGLLGLGVHPEAEPTANRPVTFSVELSGTGYVSKVIPVTINKDQFQSVKTVIVLKVADVPEGVVVEEQTVALTNNATTSAQIIKTNPGAETQQTIEIALASGTQFLDAAGKVITGGELTTQVIFADPSQESALGAFPGGSLTATNVVAEGGTQAVAGAFNPAGFANIEFYVGTTQVRGFNKPITIAMQLDPNFTNSTGAKIKAGDQLGVYSYQTSTAQWKFEKNVSVTLEGGKPVANFTTDHLTWYMVGDFQVSCSTATTLVLDAPWMKDGFTYSLTVEAVLAGKVVNSIQISASNADKTIIISDLPIADGNLSIRVLNEDGEVLTVEGTTLPANGCGVSQTVALKEPASTLPKVTLQLYVRCPGDDLVLNVLPTFYLYYRGTNETEFQLLGVVDNGFISTSALTPGAEYDFQAVWGDKVKVVNNKVVTSDNSATVGIEPGDIIGEKAGATNLEMLTEACNTIK